MEPEAAFDVTCDDVAAVMASLVGEPSTPVEPVMSIISTMGWLPGPGQYMFQRAGGIACSAGEAPSYWEVTIVPGAGAVTNGAAQRNGFWGETAGCSDRGCNFEIIEGDVLLTANIVDEGLGVAGDPDVPGDALRDLAGTADASLHDFELVDSDIVGAACERFLTPAEVSEVTGVEGVEIVDSFGGWGIPAEVYHVTNGARICLYSIGGEEYAGNQLMITTLPGGAWAFEKVGGTPVEIELADGATLSSGEHGERVLDLRVGNDWIRLTTLDDGSGAPDPEPLAATVARNLTRGHTAPQ